MNTNNPPGSWRKGWCIVDGEGRVFPGSTGFRSAQAAWNWLVVATEDRRADLRKLYKARLLK